MKGLECFPSKTDWAKAYQILERSHKTRSSESQSSESRSSESRFSESRSSESRSSESQWALWSQWTRLDPRFAEIFVKALSQDWKYLSPNLIYENLKTMPWPAAFGVLGEHCLEFLIYDQIQKKAFYHWLTCLMTSLPRAPNELFFIGHRKIAGKEMSLDARLSLECYRKWGYLGREILVNKATLGDRTLMNPKMREAALKSLMKEKPRITTEDYIQCLQGFVSRRQAQLDLQSCRFLRADGRTRGRTFRKT